MQNQKAAYALVPKMGFRTTRNNRAANGEFLCKNIYDTDLGHNQDQTIQRVRSSMYYILSVKTSHNQNNKNKVH